MDKAGCWIIDVGANGCPPLALAHSNLKGTDNNNDPFDHNGSKAQVVRLNESLGFVLLFGIDIQVIGVKISRD